ncbi:MAG: Retron-type reverse transcriptase, partial [Planctomycetes bacterium]|nr:Retron-type reverse transcriptase [Planctomycetota bacterium]
MSAAPFRDRVVQHLVGCVLERLFERRLIHETYANRVGKGTHKAIARCQEFVREGGFFLKLDIVKYFPSIDHEILLAELARVVRPGAFFELLRTIVASGSGVGFRVENPGSGYGVRGTGFGER